MTLILTMIFKNKVIQVADTRLTLGGREVEARAVKSIGVLCADARFFIGYTGIAEIEDQRTDYWIANQVSDIFRHGGYGVKQKIWQLATRMEDILPSVRYKGPRVARPSRALSLAFAGYHHSVKSPYSGPYSVPFSARASNVVRKLPGEAPTVSDTVTVETGMLRPDIAEGDFTGSIVGETSVFSAGDREAEANLARLQRVMRWVKRIDVRSMSSGETTAHRLAEVVQAASHHPKYGKYIGSTCISTVVTPHTDQMWSFQHAEERSPVVQGPHLVTPEAFLLGIQVEILPAGTE
jgi:hypothetical protein